MTDDRWRFIARNIVLAFVTLTAGLLIAAGQGLLSGQDALRDGQHRGEVERKELSGRIDHNRADIDRNRDDIERNRGRLER